ncbi:MAG TPA: hypothetical protein VKG79_02475 [Bryobacteraceae bacterium]|nr:hypothetical protein [Bryobacteraceae bacterium]
MTNATTAAGTRTSTPHWLISLFIMLAILVGNTVLIVGLLQVLTWPECIFLVLAGVALSSGILYTVVKMDRLAKED